MLRTIANWVGNVLFRNRVLTLNDRTGWDELGLTHTSDAGESVTMEKALGYGPVNQAVRMISGDVSKLPLNVYKRIDDQDRKIARTHPAQRLIKKFGRANLQLPSLKLWRRLTFSALLFENGWVWIQRNEFGVPLALYNLLPDRTQLVEAKNGDLLVESEVDGKKWYADYDDVIHLEGIREGHGAGYELVKTARHDFGLALAARKFASKFFAKGGHFGGVLQVPPGATDKARRKVEKGLDRRMGTDNAFTSLVLRDGFKWFNTTVEPEKATVTQFDEQSTRHVAHYFNMPPSKLGVKESVSYNSREADNQDYFDTCLSYWLVGILSELNLKLLTERQQAADSHFVDYLVNALMWADATSRWEIYDKGIRSEILSPDECRKFENLNKRPDGKGGEYGNPNVKAGGGDDKNDGGEGDETDDEEDQDRAAIDAQQHAATIEALRSLIADAVTRMVTRLAIHAQKAAKRDEVRDFCYNIEAQHGEKCQQIWEPVRAVCEASGLGSGHELVGQVVQHFRTWFREAELSGYDLAAWCDRYRAEQPATFAERFLGSTTDNSNEDDH